MKIAVLGAAGQLGRDLCCRLPGEVTPVTRADADLACPGAVGRVLHALRPAVVVNCAAYNLVDRAESEPASAFAVNTWAVRELAIACRDLDALLVHFSTDHVFGLDGSRRVPWREDDAPGPVSMYGLSKLSGEYVVRGTCPRHLVVRTCGLYGRRGSGGKGGNFVLTMLRLAEQGRPLRIVADQVCTPTATADLADIVVHLLERGATGLFHATNSGSCSWYEFARAIFAAAGVRAEVTPITSAEYGAAARRPVYSVLDSGALRSLGAPPLRPWQEALERFLQERRAAA
jgi:dTDP-4-dehydrorhamnose reductase